MSGFVVFFCLFLHAGYLWSQDAIVPETTPEAAAQSTTSGLAAVEAINTSAKTLIECPLIASSSDVERLKPTTASKYVCSEITKASDNSPIVTKVSPYEPLGENEHRLMFKDKDRFYQSGHYLLKRLQGQNFQAVLNVNFQSSDPELATSMLNRARKCMQDLTPYLKSPSGKQLQVLLLTPQEIAENLPADGKPVPYNINVTKEDRDYRGNAANFGSNFDCQTIGHELLHHLGLVDEYEEEANDSRTEDWACRVTTTGTSYMRNIFDAYADVVPQSMNCKCDTNCQTIAKAGEPYLSMYLSQRGNEYWINETPLKKYCKTDGKSTLLYLKSQQDRKNLQSVRDEGPKHFFEDLMIQGVMPNTDNSPTGGPYGMIYPYVCDCSEDSTGLCERQVSALKERAKSNRPIHNCPTSGGQPTERRIAAPGLGETNVEGDVIHIVSKGSGETLVTDGQMDKILSGNCQGGSPQYERCAALANLKKTDPRCVAAPECSDSQYYLWNKPAVPAPVMTPAAVPQ